MYFNNRNQLMNISEEDIAHMIGKQYLKYKITHVNEGRWLFFLQLLQLIITLILTSITHFLA